ncbi:hypothetical protein M3Y97_01103200 [Aphelenchoides bicaudatus]|nr:hypothetical protein M3Y97_01103200 [Aphelenchoides bicaudatus]
MIGFPNFKEMSIHKKARLAGWCWVVLTVATLTLLYVSFEVGAYGSRTEYNAAGTIISKTKVVWTSLGLLNVAFALLMLYGQRVKSQGMHVPYLILLVIEITVAIIIDVIHLLLFFFIFGFFFARSYSGFILVFCVILFSVLAIVLLCYSFKWFVLIPFRSMSQFNEEKKVEFAEVLVKERV